MDHSAERSLSTYLTGFALAVVLTAIPFGLVWGGLLTGTAAYGVIAVAAVLQVVVHLVFFLHLNLKSTPAENLFFLGFAAVLICIMVGGSLWIMMDLHHRMM
ncbi:MAG: cytochrome o ubiquinol oxidase subunit IV [Roseibium sp.]|uniref:cytochrome o ubiquinol oxidase subunit IV n=1 Tax=Roseibium sp. TaxID=1936156 RepID=UPI001B0FBE57|nr:cytochrome o ubiquinol oxidase subunit IV [Roseibium sp.]MBO6507633.1 cytochrome o ubiquinol oxidase subunit IV [Roseibium sp.]MBO6893764.1 cytochrome o ubiquinol oxidase subunit IV [Roseibium sp.]MBO6928585.1 cytochrome o ubiquinol oxidase subunit IV [Roseibium sp.]